MSASRRPTRAPSWARATARLTDTVLFPTPPFPLPTRITLRTLGTRSGPVPLLGARRTSALNATSTRESFSGESTAREHFDPCEHAEIAQCAPPRRIFQILHQGEDCSRARHRVVSSEEVDYR